MSLASDLVGSNFTASEGRDQFLQLLVTQLRYQDPLEPVKQENFMQQLAQFATLEGVEKLNTRFDDLLRLQQLTEGANLVDKTVAYQNDAGSGLNVGRVDSIHFSGGDLYVAVAGQLVPISRIQSLVSDTIA